MKKILIINGPNLNLLGSREPNVYGNQSFESYLLTLKQHFADLALGYYQSNVEGEIINTLHAAKDNFDAIVINAGGYSHTSVAIADAIAAIGVPTVEVHISNVYAREEFRHTLLLAPKCVGVITGFGLRSYELALRYLSEM
jgi:3-dehydroquinate dehydratase-2